MEWDDAVPLTAYNQPRMQIMGHCLNMIRSCERHYWADGEREIEADEYKDFFDTAKVLKAMIEGRGWVPPKAEREANKRRSIQGSNFRDDQYTNIVSDISLN